MKVTKNKRVKDKNQSMHKYTFIEILPFIKFQSMFSLIMLILKEKNKIEQC